jgi:1-aminocyclopropane-1-carboxylate deaminase/D-cysteine desulfhydrase-like pyridoxal-dependent ACC family enzyme
LPWTALGELPTPVLRARKLGRTIGLRSLYIKHDNLAGDVYGGSKMRKLEPLFWQAVSEGRHSVVTTGGVGSNQALATALYGRKLGLEVSLLLVPQMPSQEVREHLLAEIALGAKLELLEAGDENAALERRARKSGPKERPYVIPEGATTPRGDAGFVNAGFELAEQVRAGLLPEPDVVYIPLGTGGSAAGLAVGLQAAGLGTRVVAVRVASQRYGTRALLFAEARRVTEFLHGLDATFPDAALDDDRIVVDDHYVGRGYALPSAAGRAAMEVGRAHGIELDPTYSAKAFAALMGNATKLEPQVVLFWLTYDARKVKSDRADPGDLPGSFRGFFPHSR